MTTTVAVAAGVAAGPDTMARAGTGDAGAEAEFAKLLGDFLSGGNGEDVSLGAEREGHGARPDAPPMPLEQASSVIAGLLAGQPGPGVGWGAGGAPRDPARRPDMLPPAAPPAMAGEGETVTVVAGVTVLHKETHLAPVSPPPFAGQSMETAHAAPPAAPPEARAEALAQAQQNVQRQTAETEGAIAPDQAVAADAAESSVPAGAKPQPPSAPASQRKPAAHPAPTAPAVGRPVPAPDGASAPDSRPREHATVQETVLAPKGAQPEPATPPLPAAQQIVERLVREAPPVPRDTVRLDHPGGVPAQTYQSPVKVLHIQLQPAELGTVTVHMSLKADALDLRLEVHRPETARLIQQDHETLSTMLRSAGYLVDAVAVRVTDAAAAATPQGAPGQQSAGQQPGSPQPDGRPAGGDAQGQRHGHHGSHGNRGGNADETRQTHRAGGGVYV